MSENQQLLGPGAPPTSYGNQAAYAQQPNPYVQQPNPYTQQPNPYAQQPQGQTPDPPAQFGPGGGSYPPGAQYPPGQPGMSAPQYPPGQSGGMSYPPGTSAPPPQIMGGDPLQMLAGVQKLVIKEKVNALEVAGDLLGCCCVNQENTYEVFEGQGGQKVLTVKEESSACQRCLCKPNHAHKLHFTDPSGVQTMIVDKPFGCARCPSFIDCCRAESTLLRGANVDDGRAMLGHTKEPCCGGIFFPKLEVFEGTRDNEFAVIEGPSCCFGGCTQLCFDQNFLVKDFNGGEVASVVRERPSELGSAFKQMVSDTDVYTLSYNQSVTAQQKAVLLSSLFLLDYMFFENGSMIQRDANGCSVTLCNLYCCGAVLPCSLSCSDRNEDK